MQDVLDCNDKSVNQIPLEERIVTLNQDQRRIFDKVAAQLRHQLQHEQEKCQCDDTKPLHMFINGVGGTGKSFLIQTIKAFTDSLWEIADVTCQLAAPTGLAAANIIGLTLHRIFKLPVEHEGRQAEYWLLPKDEQKKLRTVLRSMKLLIVDEVSMVSSLNDLHTPLDERDLWRPWLVWWQERSLLWRFASAPTSPWQASL